MLDGIPVTCQPGHLGNHLGKLGKSGKSGKFCPTFLCIVCVESGNATPILTALINSFRSIPDDGANPQK